jgi:hypothetical protein
MSAPLTRLRGNDPSGYVLSGPEAHEARALSTREEAEPFLTEIEQVSYALGLFWDHGPLDVGDDELAAAREMAAFLQTMPANLKRRIHWHIADERRKSRPLLPLTVLGKTFPGSEP